MVGSLAVSLSFAAPADAATPQPPAEKPNSLDPGTVEGRDDAPRLEAAPASYTIVAGDTVSGIAERFGLSAEFLLALNGLDWSTLVFPGQTLALGGSAPATNEVDTEQTPSTDTHTIAAGDTLWSLSERYGLTIQAIADASGIGRDSALQIGQQLTIPSGTPPPASAAAPAAMTRELMEPSLGAVTLSDEMRANALLIIATARELRINDYGIIVALAAAAQESGLINVNHGDRDSLGLFQQRPSAGWGSPDQVRDPAWSIPAFFRGVNSPYGSTVGLLSVENWESLSVTEAAQAVQISDYPNHYAKWEEAARAWLAELG